MFSRQMRLEVTLGLAVLALTALAGQCEAPPAPAPTSTSAPPTAAATARPPAATSTPGAPAPTTGSSTMRLEPEQMAGQSGKTVDISVVIDNVTDLGSFEFAVRFNPAVACVTEVKMGPFLGSTGRGATPLGPRIDCATGQAKFGAFTFPSGAGGPDGSGIIAVITFQALATGESELTLNDVKATDTRGTPFPVPVLRNGTLTVR